MFPAASLQHIYGMLDREIEDDLLDYCAKNNIGVLIYGALQKGLLSGKFSKERGKNLPPNDHRRNDPRFQEPELSANMRLADGLKDIAAKYGRTVAQLCVAWVLRKREVTSAILGARKTNQIVETIRGADFTLDVDDCEKIEALLEVRLQHLTG
jgi:aryl-alcohol dehydrogenase-like predicted oxidoreductase